MNCTCCGNELDSIIFGHEAHYFCSNRDCPESDLPVNELDNEAFEKENYSHLGYAKYEARHVRIWAEQLIQEMKRGDVEDDKIIERLQIIINCGDSAITEIDKFIQKV